jgi:beta-lactamase regulating signal transducer with metallopeptidase domain
MIPAAGSWISGSWMIPSSWAFPLGIALRALGIAYLLVLSYIFLAYLKRQRQLKWVLGFSFKPPVELEEAFQPLAESLHVRRSRLLVLAGATSPATFGWIRPTILLPEVCLEQDRSDLEDIFLHELHHVRRCDFVWNGLAAACRALLFFHPAAWYALRKMQFDRELACDLAVVSHSPGRRAKYAECLTRFARLNLSQGARTWGVDFAASSEHLKARVHSILTESEKPSVWLVCLRAACGLALFAGFIGFAPSMAVLLSYAPRQISQPQMSQPSFSIIGDSGTENGRRAARRVRSVRPAAAASTDRALASPVEASQFPQSALEPDHQQVQDTVSTPKLVPGLIRRHLPPGARGAAGDSRATHQSITLIDPGSAAQGGNKANPSRGGKSLQQSVLLAGGIYKRLSDVKPDR